MMSKRLIIYFITFLVFGMVSFYVHQLLLENNDLSLRFSLKNVYIFQGISSFIICAALNVLSTTEKFNSQIGFLYLATFALKIVAFSTIFYKSILSIKDISKIESLNLLIPLGVFLIIEVYFISRILNTNLPVTK